MCFSCSSENKLLMDKFPVYGMIYDDFGREVSGARLQLDKKETISSDFNGRFVFAEMYPGEYHIVITKNGYEPFEDDIIIRTQQDIIYIKMITLEGLYAQYLKAFDKNEWDKANSLLSRAQAIDNDDPLLRYARAVFQYAQTRKDRNWQEAKSILTDLLADGYRFASVYLLLADISEYDEGNLEAAASYLEASLLLEYNPIIDERLKKMKTLI